MAERMDRMTLSVAEAAEQLGVSTRFAYDLANRADFPTIRLGRRIRVSRDGLREWVHNKEQNRNAAMGAANTHGGGQI